MYDITARWISAARRDLTTCVSRWYSRSEYKSIKIPCSVLLTPVHDLLRALSFLTLLISKSATIPPRSPTTVNMHFLSLAILGLSASAIAAPSTLKVRQDDISDSTSSPAALLESLAAQLSAIVNPYITALNNGDKGSDSSSQIASQLSSALTTSQSNFNSVSQMGSSATANSVSSKLTSDINGMVKAINNAESQLASSSQRKLRARQNFSVSSLDTLLGELTSSVSPTVNAVADLVQELNLTA